MAQSQRVIDLTKKGENGSRLCESAGKKTKKRQQRNVRREEEGSSSNRLEIAAFVLAALRGTPVTKPMLYLCDNQVLLKAIERWVDNGGKATLVGAPDANIL